MATKNYAISADPQLMALRQTVAALMLKKAELRQIVARLSLETTEQDFNTAIDSIVAGGDPVLASAQLDNSKALQAAVESLRLLEAAIARARTAAGAEEPHARDRYLDRVRPEYRATAQKFATALLQLADVQADFYALEKKFADQGLGTFPTAAAGPFGLKFLGNILDENSAAAAWLIAAIAHGVIQLGDVPAAISDGWHILDGLQEDGSLPAENPSRAKLRGLPATVSLSSFRVRSLDHSLARRAG